MFKILLHINLNLTFAIIRCILWNSLILEKGTFHEKEKTDFFEKNMCLDFFFELNSW